MERIQPRHVARKSSSFSFSSSSSREGKKLRESDRNFSLGAIRFDDLGAIRFDIGIFDKINEDEKGRRGDQEEKVVVEETPTLNSISQDIDRFLALLLSHVETRSKDEEKEAVAEAEKKDEEEEESTDEKLPEAKESTDEKLPEESKESTDEKLPEESKESTDEKLPEESKESTDEKLPEESKESTDEKLPEESKESTDEMLPEESKESTDENLPEESKESTDEKLPEESKESTDEKLPEESKESSTGKLLLPEIPESKIEKFTELVEQEIVKYESGMEKLLPEHHDDGLSLLDAIDQMSKMMTALSPFACSDPKYMEVANEIGIVLHHAMSFLEDEFYALLEESSSAKKQDPQGSTKTKRPPSFSRSVDQEQRVMSPTSDPTISVDSSYPSPEIIARLRAIANTMISAGYDTECFRVFAVARHNAFWAAVSELGFEKIAIDDVQRMPWDQLEAEVLKWTKAFRHSLTTSLILDRDLCDTVFSSHRPIASSLFQELTAHAVLSFLNFPEALAMTKRSAEKLFKVLDVYEALRDMVPMINSLFPCSSNEEEEEEEKTEESTFSSPVAAKLKSEISSVQSRVGEAAVAIFCDLESSIKSDTGKNAVPGGAVHPLTRYVMNYLKFSCEYIGTLEQIFKDHNKSDEEEENSNAVQTTTTSTSATNYGFNHGSNDAHNQTPFAVQLSHVMDLLQANLDSKAKLYKDLALSNIFLMNNGRYIVQKIKGSGEIKGVLGDNWYRRRSSDLRQYHNNYKRETWSKVLTCFKDDGLTVKGTVHKPVLKERFKSFNAMFEEIHKTQCMWIVSDGQLQSELRVSVSAVVVPAYRSFLGRFSQYLDPGRQTDKYIKFGPEDLETYVDELFDGNPSTLLQRRR